MVDAEVVRDTISAKNLVIRPDARASLQINLITEIVVTGVDDEEHDLTLNFLALRPPSVAALQRLVPEIADVSANLSNAQNFLGLDSASKQTRSEANKTRVIAAVNARGDEFLRGLERYRTTPERLESDDQKITALQNYFDFGQKIYQFSFLQTAALNTMCEEYLKILLLVNRIDDHTNKLILSKISKEEGYLFATDIQDVIDELARTCERYCGLHPPAFQERAYADVLAVFITTPSINVDHDFEALLVHKNNDVLHNISLAECRDPSNFGELDNFKKRLTTFLLNLSRHRDDPVVSVAKKLENRAEAARTCVA